MIEIQEKVKRFVNASFNDKNTTHFERTVFWIKQFKPNADEALLIAGYAHDIERANRDLKAIKEGEKGFPDKDFLRYHQTKGGEIMGQFLSNHRASKKLIERVKLLISSHEDGGNEDQNLLKDCDTISFFETNAEMFIKDKVKVLGKNKVKDKFDWMFNRLSSNRAKEIARPLFLKALKELEEQN